MLLLLCHQHSSSLVVVFLCRLKSEHKQHDTHKVIVQYWVIASHTLMKSEILQWCVNNWCLTKCSVWCGTWFHVSILSPWFQGCNCFSYEVRTHLSFLSNVTNETTEALVTLKHESVTLVMSLHCCALLCYASVAAVPLESKGKN